MSGGERRAVPPRGWMCRNCTTDVPSLAEACGVCRRGGLPSAGGGGGDGRTTTTLAHYSAVGIAGVVGRVTPVREGGGRGGVAAGCWTMGARMSSATFGRDGEGGLGDGDDGGDFLWNLEDVGGDVGAGWRSGSDGVSGEGGNDADAGGYYEMMGLGLGSSSGTRLGKARGTKKETKTAKKRKAKGQSQKTASSSSPTSLYSPSSSSSFGGGVGIDDLDETSFVLHDASDEEHINAIHNIVRRDVWEGFVVGTTSTTASSARGKGDDTGSRSTSRLERYAGTIGFRCRFCKVAPPGERAEKSAVYPRSLERIYLSNIRFQRDHIM